MDVIRFLIDFIIHLDRYLAQIIAQYGIITYGILFIIIFIETGLVFTPFLPGDSLLFASGAFAALGSLNIISLIILLIIAAIFGDTANYWIGRFFGEKMVAHPKIPLNQSHLEKTEQFFKKHGGKTIILARFVPIVRTFAPFIAGAGQMSYSTFIFYNVIGGVSWVMIATLAGYFFGNIKWVKENFSLVIFAVIFISLIPLILELVKHKFSKSTTS